MSEAKFFGTNIPPSSCFLPCVPPGDIQVGMMDKKGQLEVEIIRARGLVVKPGSKTLPGKTEEVPLLFLVVCVVSFLGWNLCNRDMNGNASICTAWGLKRLTCALREPEVDEL